jgi:hypothetical protein
MLVFPHRLTAPALLASVCGFVFFPPFSFSSLIHIPPKSTIKRQKAAGTYFLLLTSFHDEVMSFYILGNIFLIQDDLDCCVYFWT